MASQKRQGTWATCYAPYNHDIIKEADGILATISTQSRRTVLTHQPHLLHKLYTSSATLAIEPRTGRRQAYPTSSPQVQYEIFTQPWRHKRTNWTKYLPLTPTEHHTAYQTPTLDVSLTFTPYVSIARLSFHHLVLLLRRFQLIDFCNVFES